MAPRKSRVAATPKDDGAVSLRSLLLEHFNEYQDSLGDLEIARKNVRSALQEYALAKNVAALTLATNQPDEGTSNSDDDLCAILTHLVDCAIANAMLDASKRIVELVAAVIVDTTNKCNDDTDEANNLDFDNLLDRIVQFSKCTTESVRSLSTFLLTQWFNLALQAPGAKDHDLLTALQQAILPRFTDKAVSVRAETLKISALAWASDPDLLTAGCYLLQHDPSANNRKLAAEQIPVTLQTAEYFVYRIRDVKGAVRVAALAALERAAVRGDDLVLDAAQLADIVLTGRTDRCEESSQATERVICKWYQAVHFNVTDLLKLLDLVHNPDAAEVVLKVLHKVDPAVVLENDLSAAEIQSFRDGLQDSLEVSLMDETVLAEQVFAARLGLTFLESAREKERYLNRIIPDIPRLCQLMERNVATLIESLSQEDYDQDVTDRIAIFCDQLLQLGMMTDVDEEGSRRVLVAAMKSFLSFVATPHSLIAPCVETLIKVSRHIRSDIDSIFVTLQQLKQDLQEAATVRMLAIANLALEEASLDVPDVIDFLTNDSALIRQGAVECFGKMGMYVSLETVQSDYWPVLLKVAQDDDEEIAIRSQAALALTDFSILMMGQQQQPLDPEFRILVDDWLVMGQKGELSGVGSEIAVKVLVAQKGKDNEGDDPIQRKWIAMLLLKFFESNHAGEQDDSELEVGSPARLQQLLALFLPIIARLNREAFIGSLHKLLDACPKTTSTKIVEYVVQTAETCPAEIETSSPKLLAAIAVASFLSEKADDISKTLLRSLCKLLGNWEIDIDKEFYDNLSVLKELVDEMLLNDIVQDSTARDCLQACYEKLGDVEMEEDVLDEDDDDNNDSNKDDEQDELGDNLTNAVGRLEISVGGTENTMVSTTTTPAMATPLPGKTVEAFVSLKGSLTMPDGSSLRRSRRFRPSN